MTTDDRVSSRVPQPVLAAGAFTHTGLGATLLGGPLALFGVLRGRRAARGLPSRVLIAVTQERVHVFGASITWQPTSEVAAWQRSDVHASSRPGGLGPILSLTAAGHEAIELQGVNEGAKRVADLLAVRAAVA